MLEAVQPLYPYERTEEFLLIHSPYQSIVFSKNASPFSLVGWSVSVSASPALICLSAETAKAKGLICDPFDLVRIELMTKKRLLSERLF